MKINEIQSKDWTLSLEKFGDIMQGDRDIAQCVLVIIMTQQGSDPLRPDFGVDLLAYIDAPISVAAANLTKAIAEQVNKWEPRVTVSRITYTVEESRLKFKVDWKSINGTTSTTSATYNLSSQ